MNKHIKVINGRKYYYSSIRVGKKVTSKYLGPVERVRTRKKGFEEGIVQEEPVQEEVSSDQNADYIG